MKTPAVFYVPGLHRNFAPEGVPPSVAFFPVGLTAAPSSAGNFRPPSVEAQAAEAAAAARLPLSPAESRAVLEEMLRLGQELGGAHLRQAEAAERLRRQEGSEARERADLAAFANTGALAGERPADADAENLSRREILIRRQKTLLLAWSLEERRHELLGLNAGLRAAEDALRLSLGEGDDADDFAEAGGPPPGAPSGQTFGEAEDAPGQADWRPVIEAALAFAPEDAALLTDDPAMTRDLKEAGLLQPFPEDRAFLCADWPERLRNGLLFAALPGWRLTGRRSAPAGLPWLLREVEILAARPEPGWLDDGWSAAHPVAHPGTHPGTHPASRPASGFVSESVLESSSRPAGGSSSASGPSGGKR